MRSGAGLKRAGIASASVVFLLCAVPLGATGRSTRLDIPFKALIVGGGPDLKHNQAAIESNVRYLDRLLPTDTPRRILFADGDPQRKDVLCEDENNKEFYRAPQISKIDGAAQLAPVKAELDTIAQGLSAEPKTPVLLYFTGHGSGDEASSFNNNRFDLWSNEELTVKQLASSIGSFPSTTPVTVVMVQCFSGAFGNLIFQDGNPTGPLGKQQICGFFACLSSRMAAGCTPAIKEADYKDFTGYFFAALTGKNRTGSAVTGADYNHDGAVTMDEAFAYTLIHDDSIDTPVCTSDVFLRRFVKTPYEEVFARPYSQIKSWANPAQLAVLESLSDYLHLSGEDRPQETFNRMRTIQQSDEPRAVHTIRFVRMCNTVALAHDLMSSSDSDLKAKYQKLIKAEHGNPFK